MAGAEGTRLFVGNVPGAGAGGPAGAERRLREAFSAWGAVQALQLKSKPGDTDKQFAFVTLQAPPEDIDTCIRHFSQEEWNGSKLYVTRARESFLERLQKEREQAQAKIQIPEEQECSETKSTKQKATKITTPKAKKQIPKVNGLHNDEEKIYKIDNYSKKNDKFKTMEMISKKKYDFNKGSEIIAELTTEKTVKQKVLPCAKEMFTDDKKRSADAKRLESMKKMRKEFNEKKQLIKNGLAGVDKVCNKRIKFSDVDEFMEDTPSSVTTHSVKHHNMNGKAGKPLFDDDDDDEERDDVNFQIKEQFEGKKGQKVLELQSRYKSDKRFTLDERFIEEDDIADDETPAEPMNLDNQENDDQIQLARENEKLNQLNILENVLGVAIKSSITQPAPINDKKKTQTKMGMLRFDPNHPDHAKFLAPKENLQKEVDNSKKKKSRRKEGQEPEQPIQKVEVSQEQFYKVSDTLKEAIVQPNSFSLRSLFSKSEENYDETDKDQDTGFTPLVAAKKDKGKNPLDRSANNPFKYDSSDSEPEPEENVTPAADADKPSAEDGKAKAVWKEKLFFSRFDNRFKEGLAFFNNADAGANKERRELKVLMKKRLYNRSRKEQMFQKKIGGRRKPFNKNRKQTR